MKNNHSQLVCSHWSAKDRTCLLCQCGLYLPVTEHIEIYCEGGNFSSCSQYMAQAVPSKGLDSSGQVANHRRFRRVPGRFSFRLAERAAGALNQLIDDAATTVDLSPGGIRFESYRSLHRDAEVIFSLNGDFSDTPLQGTGRVKWCHSLENAPLYHAGIAFADPVVAAAISERLGLYAN